MVVVISGEDDRRWWVAFRLNGALNSEEGFGGVRVVVRNRAGTIVGSSLWIRSKALTPCELLKLWDFGMPLEMTLSWNFSRIIVEGDSEHVVQALNRAVCD